MRVWFDGADTDHDGALSLDEFRADALRFFRVLDADGDGVLRSPEILRYERLIFPEMLGGQGGPGPQAAASAQVFGVAYGGQQGGGGFGGQAGGGHEGRGGGRSGGRHGQPSEAGPGGSSSQGAGRFGLLAEPEPVTASDLNFDGLVTREEFAARAAQRFAALDDAGAGRLTYAALEARAPHPAGRAPGYGRRPRSA